MRSLLALVALAGLNAAPAAESADPAYYVKMPTWQASMLASREALIKHQAVALEASAFKPAVTGVLRGGQEAQAVSVDVSGLDLLWLLADVGGDTYDWDQAIWGEPRLIAPDGSVVLLTTLKPASVKVGWGHLIVDNNHANQGLRIASRRFAHGFWAHAPSALCFVLNKKFARFEAWVGVDVSAGTHGTVRFHVADRADSVDMAGGLWPLLARDFGASREMAWEQEDDLWLQDWKPGDLAPLAARYAKASGRVKSLADEAARLAPTAADAAGLQKVRDLYYRSRRIAEATAKAGGLKFEPLRLAIADLIETFGERYPKGQEFLKRLADIEKAVLDAAETAKSGKLADAEKMANLVSELETLKAEALLANPLLSFDRMLLVRRSEKNLALPANWQSNSCLPRGGLDNEIDVLPSPQGRGGEAGKLTTLYKPEGGKFVGDIDLHFDGDRFLFSSVGKNGRWQVFEMTLKPPAGSQPAGGYPIRQLTGDQPDVDSYDACYLPDGRIMFCSTANFVGVPCVFGGSHVSVLYRMDADGQNIRQLCFEQDHDWCPTVLNNGRILYLRWEYTDTPHSQTRLLFHMNPDGTEQMEYYGSNSYWPNSFFYARPIPGHPTKVVGIATGHHGVPRMGELIILDPARGRQEDAGAVQRIPGHGQKVQMIIRDALVDGSWPKFLHPYPLSEKHFLVSCKPTAQSHWGIYLVDTFDNMLLLHEEPGYAMLEPVPVRQTPKPPVIPDKVDPTRTDALVYMVDVYQGGGLAGIPRGTVKRLRLFTYHFAYQGMGGLLGVVGMDGPWDPKRIIGTVPVEADGSAYFRMPANTPIAVQPLDAEGKALQLMRSWMTAMPGEVLSCVGCHEKQNSSPPAVQTLALAKPPAEIQPWLGPTRCFSYPREVQPVIDAYCVSCHDGRRAVSGPRADSTRGTEAPPTMAGTTPPDLRNVRKPVDYTSVTPGTGGGNGYRFSVGYIELARYVRRSGIESDYHMLTPMEYHADTTELVQMLQKGHHGVRLSPEAWDRLVTWIDLNAPYHGTWTEMGHNPGRQRQRRLDLARLYANLHDDPEADTALPPATLKDPASPPLPDATSRRFDNLREVKGLAGWPFDAAEARKRQAAAGPAAERAIELGDGLKLNLVLIPAGEFLMGNADGWPDERPATPVKIGRPFWIGKCEVTNEQFARFDPLHDSRVESKNAYQFGIHGYPLDGPRQPVVRLSWKEAMAFCDWLSAKTGEKFTLPTEAQWEYACRAGTATAFSFGGPDADFSRFANLADAKMREFASNPYAVFGPLTNATPYDDWIPKDTRFNDGGLLSVDIGTYQPNAWGLCDMHGNMAEWTRSECRPYPYRDDDGRNGAIADLRLPIADLRTQSEIGNRKSEIAQRFVVRGGSWRDRPYRCTSAYRLAYPWFQRVYNVTFRVACEVKGKTVATAGK